MPTLSNKPRSAETNAASDHRRTDVETFIRPAAGWQPLNLGELWRYRDLLRLLTFREIKLRYKQTILGVVWTVLQPTMLMLAFVVFLGGNLSSGETPYPIFVFTGLLLWLFFASSVAGAANSVVYSEPIVTKVYVPRLLFPLSAVCAALIDFLIACCVLGLLMFWYGVVPGWSILLVPAVVALVMMAAFDLGSLFGAINVSYRDARHVVVFLMQVGLFATPTIYREYPSSSAGPQVASADDENAGGEDAIEPGRGAVLEKVSQSEGRGWIALNPMVGLIRFFRAAVLGRDLPWDALPIPVVTVVVLLVVGLHYFRRAEDSFADII